MGRRGNAERLANPVFKMAAISMADFPKFQRPVNEACSKKKIVCPEASCQKENLFFEENGLGHHFRTIHRKEVNAKVVSKAVVKTRELYGQETLEYIAALSEWKSKVSICIIHVLHFKWNSNVMQIASTGFPCERFGYKVLNPNFSHCRSPKVNILMWVARGQIRGYSPKIQRKLPSCLECICVVEVVLNVMPRRANHARSKFDQQSSKSILTHGSRPDQ